MEFINKNKLPRYWPIKYFLTILLKAPYHNRKEDVSCEMILEILQKIKNKLAAYFLLM